MRYPAVKGHRRPVIDRLAAHIRYFDHYSAAARPRKLAFSLENSYLQIGAFLSPLFQFSTRFQGFLIVQGQVGDALFAAPVGHVTQYGGQIEQAKGQLIEFLWIVGLRSWILL